jgi:hypothetical protein
MVGGGPDRGASATRHLWRLQHVSWHERTIEDLPAVGPGRSLVDLLSPTRELRLRPFDGDVTAGFVRLAHGRFPPRRWRRPSLTLLATAFHSSCSRSPRMVVIPAWSAPP